MHRNTYLVRIQLVFHCGQSCLDDGLAATERRRVQDCTVVVAKFIEKRVAFDASRRFYCRSDLAEQTRRGKSGQFRAWGKGLGNVRK